MTAAKTGHPWTAESLFAKAHLYVEQMEEATADDWQHGLWSALSLELLARAALAHISPTLLADASDWRNLMYALGNPPTAKKFSPASISTNEVLRRLSELVPTFTEEVAGFCRKHVDRRNSELHTGELAFSSLGTSQWLPGYYQACHILLETMGKELADLFSNPDSASGMIDTLKDAAAKAVQKSINAHSEVWSSKSSEEKEEATAQAIAWATRHAGHRVLCPACNSTSLLQGTPSGVVSTTIEQNDVIQRQTMYPSAFECIACGLRISGLSKLSACGLGDAFTATTTYSAAEFFELYTEDELEEARGESPRYEEDFNE
jgi:hypothetical protein